MTYVANILKLGPTVGKKSLHIDRVCSKRIKPIKLFSIEVILTCQLVLKTSRQDQARKSA